MTDTPSDAAVLSRLLYEAEEAVEYLADIVEARYALMDPPRVSQHERDLAARIKAYRQTRGWNPNGYGGET